MVRWEIQRMRTAVKRLDEAIQQLGRSRMVDSLREMQTRLSAKIIKLKNLEETLHEYDRLDNVVHRQQARLEQLKDDQTIKDALLSLRDILES